jgi:hypothetical protein
MIRCSECSHENMDGLEYCDACGAKLPAGASAEPVPAAPAAAPVDVPEPSPPSQADVPAEEASTGATATVATPVPVSVPTPSAGTVQNAQLTILRGGTVGKVFPLQVGVEGRVGTWRPDNAFKASPNGNSGEGADATKGSGAR